MLVFAERRKPEYPEKNLPAQRREPTTNSTHIRRRVRESHPGHIGGRRVLSPLRHPCSPGFDRLSLLGDHMMAFAIGTVQLAVSQGAIISGPGTTHIIPTVKSALRGTTIPLTGMIGLIVGVEPPFTVQTIIRTVEESRKRRTAIKMMIGFQ